MNAVIVLAVVVVGAEIDFSSLKVNDYGTITPAAVHKVAGGFEQFFSFATLQVIDETHVLVTVRHSKVNFQGIPSLRTFVVMFEMPTSGMADDQEIEELPGKWLVSGTHKYATASGTNTVFVVRPVTDDELRAVANAEAERQKALAQEKFAQRFAEGKSLWKDATGKHSIEAIYDGFEIGHVWLAKKDGSRVKVPLAKLSSRDRKRAIDTARAAGHFR